jgi:hypothetical protein
MSESLKTRNGDRHGETQGKVVFFETLGTVLPRFREVG